MELVFTEYVRSSNPGEQLPSEGFDAVWEKLRDVLASEMRKRSLWHLAPRCLGIYQGASWREPGALEELMIDCFKATFLARLPSLKGLLEVQDNIEGLIFRNVRNFLYERQKQFDPLGFTAFDAIHNAAQELIDQGKLHVLRGPARIRNATVLGFSPGGRPEPVREVDLEAPAREWAEDLLPDLVTARGQRRRSLEQDLAAALADLRHLGVESFRFQDVVRPFKRQVRQTWTALWDSSQGEAAFDDDEGTALVRWVRPDSGFEERQSYQELLHCMAEQLARFEATRKTRAQLLALWDFLRCQVAESPDAAPLSRRTMAERLEIHRSRLAELFRHLGRLVEACKGREAEA